MLQLFIFQVIQPESQLAVFTSFHLVLSRVTYALHFDVSCAFTPSTPFDPCCLHFLETFFSRVSFHVLNIFRLPLRFFSKNLWTDRRAESQVRKPFDLRDDPLIRVILAKVRKWRSRNEVETKKWRKSCENTNSSNLSD